MTTPNLGDVRMRLVEIIDDAFGIQGYDEADSFLAYLADQDLAICIQITDGLAPRERYPLNQLIPDGYLAVDSTGGGA